MILCGLGKGGFTSGGLRLVKKVAAGRFCRIIYPLLVIVGIKLLWDGSKLFTYTSI